MKEIIYRFGENDRLIGVYTTPIRKNSQANYNASQRPTFIFVNSGLVHRVGPFRVYTKLARELAEHGFNTFRIDLSGKGDSTPNVNNNSLRENVVEDIKAAMNALSSTVECEEFIVCGICTGADNAYDIAFNDNRIKGVIPIDGYAYKTKMFYFYKMLMRAMNLKSWQYLIARVLGIKRFQHQPNNDVSAFNSYKTIFPALDVFKQRMKRSIQLNQRFLVIFTGGWHMFYNHTSQFRNSLSSSYSRSHISVEFNPYTDHTFILNTDKRWLFDKIITWSEANF